jgi:hypothetical protein
MSDFGFDENFYRDLAEYFQTPEGQANLAASGFQVPDVVDPAPTPVAAAPVAAAPVAAAPVAAAPTITAPLTRDERKKIFVEQRSAELRAAGKPVDIDALEKRFDELSKTTEGRTQITTVVQRAEPKTLQAIVPDKVSIPDVQTEPETLQAIVPDKVSIPDVQTDFTQQINDAYAGKNAYYGGGPDALGGPDGGPGGGGATGSEGATVVDTYFEGSGPDRFRITIFSNGYIKRVAAPEVDQATILANNEREARQKNARDTIAETLATYGLSDLADYTYSEIIAKDITDPAAIIFKLRDQPAYQKRFGANAARLKAGLPELSPSEYIDLEDMYRTVIRSNGLPTGFYDSEDDTRKLLEGSVSPSEFQRRIQEGYNAVANADPEVKRQFKELYGVTDSELAAYFLDPAKGETILTTRARAAQIAARGAEQGGIQLTGQFAENLAARGITEQQARAGFAEVGALGELRQTFAGETALSSEQLAGAAFGIDVAAQQELERKRRQRTGEFAGGGSFARTTGETSGSMSTAVGGAQ